MVTTVAPTIPVEAASSAPTNVTAIPMPPRRRRSKPEMLMIRSSAIRDRCRTEPMKMNSGMAIRISLFHVAVDPRRNRRNGDMPAYQRVDENENRADSAQCQRDRITQQEENGG